MSTHFLPAHSRKYRPLCTIYAYNRKVKVQWLRCLVVGCKMMPTMCSLFPIPSTVMTLHHQTAVGETGKYWKRLGGKWQRAFSLQMQFGHLGYGDAIALERWYGSLCNLRVVNTLVSYHSSIKPTLTQRCIYAYILSLSWFQTWATGRMSRSCNLQRLMSPNYRRAPTRRAHPRTHSASLHARFRDCWWSCDSASPGTQTSPDVLRRATIWHDDLINKNTGRVNGEHIHRRWSPCTHASDAGSCTFR